MVTRDTAYPTIDVVTKKMSLLHLDGYLVSGANHNKYLPGDSYENVNFNTTTNNELFSDNY